MIRYVNIGMLLLLALDAAFAADFGRIFTTPEQRQKLDALRYRTEQPEPNLILQQKSFDKPEPEPEILAPIRLDGLIYRQNGQNAAWINEASTLEGDIGLQDIGVDPKKISQDSVEIVLPGGGPAIKLKVGEKYLPSPGKKIDLEHE